MMHQLTQLLKSLRLSGIMETLEVRNKEAIERKVTYIEFLTLLIQDEIERRNQARLATRLRRASFDPAKTLESFDFSFNPTIDKKHIYDLATCHFIEKKENVWFLGQSGVGKTHLGQALANEACRRAIDVTFTTVDKMLKDINGGRADGTISRRMRKYTQPPLLVLDEFALKPFNNGSHAEDFAEDFYDVINERCERGSTIITSNRSEEEWPEVFGDALLASATLDRLAFRVHRIEITGPSYRARGNNKGRKR